MIGGYMAVGIRGNKFSSPHLPAHTGPKDTSFKLKPKTR